MAHKWVPLVKDFLNGKCYLKCYTAEEFASLSEAYKAYEDAGGWRLFYPGRKDSRNFLFTEWSDSFGRREVQVFFEKVY